MYNRDYLTMKRDWCNAKRTNQQQPRRRNGTSDGWLHTTKTTKLLGTRVVVVFANGLVAHIDPVNEVYSCDCSTTTTTTIIVCAVFFIVHVFCNCVPIDGATGGCLTTSFIDKLFRIIPTRALHWNQ